MDINKLTSQFQQDLIKKVIPFYLDLRHEDYRKQYWIDLKVLPCQCRRVLVALIYPIVFSLFISR
jgi:hypothetical protein